MTLQRAGFLRSVAVVLALAGASAALFWWQSADLFRPVPVGMLRTDDAAMLKHGALIYQARCASCHGVHLEGQANWRERGADGRLPAPPHDASGHTWHHPDDVLFRIVREGTAAVVGGGYESDMPGFADVLSDADIHAVLDYIKSTWPERERRYQERVSEAN